MGVHLQVFMRPPPCAAPQVRAAANSDGGGGSHQLFSSHHSRMLNQVALASSSGSWTSSAAVASPAARNVPASSSGYGPSHSRAIASSLMQAESQLASTGQQTSAINCAWYFSA